MSTALFTLLTLSTAPVGTLVLPLWGRDGDTKYATVFVHLPFSSVDLVKYTLYEITVNIIVFFYIGKA